MNKSNPLREDYRYNGTTGYLPLPNLLKSDSNIKYPSGEKSDSIINELTKIINVYILKFENLFRLWMIIIKIKFIFIKFYLKKIKSI